MAIAKQTRIENRNLRNWKGVSEGISRILGMNTFLFFPCPVSMVACAIICLIISLVPLQSLGASKFRRSITDQPTFSLSLCDGMPEGSKAFKNSVEYCTASVASTTVPIDFKNLLISR